MNKENVNNISLALKIEETNESNILR